METDCRGWNQGNSFLAPEYVQEHGLNNRPFGKAEITILHLLAKTIISVIIRYEISIPMRVCLDQRPVI